MKTHTYNITLILMLSISITFASRAQDSDFYCPMDDFEHPVETSMKISIPSTSSADITVGKYKPGKGILRVLFVYIRFADDHTSMSYWNSYPNPNTIWDVEPWMALSIDQSTSTNSNNYFNISNYFSEVSRNSFRVIGRAAYIGLPPKSTFTDDGTPNGTPLHGNALRKAANIAALEYLDNSIQIDLSYYDKFDYLSEYHHEETSDGIIDMVYMIYRAPNNHHFITGTGWNKLSGIASLGGSGQHTLPSGLKVGLGFGGNSSGVTMNMGNKNSDKRKERFDDSYIHELGHYLMGGDHPYPGSTSMPGKGIKGYWGIFGGHQATNSINAYEQELLGWISVPELTDTGTETLKDFITTGDALKYVISSTEFYYFENRQRIQSTTGIDNTYDQPNWNDGDKGLLILHVKEDASGDYLYSWDNSLGSIVSDGNWDWTFEGFKPVCNESGEPAFEKDVPNRFGVSFF